MAGLNRFAEGLLVGRASLLPVPTISDFAETNFSGAGIGGGANFATASLTWASPQLLWSILGSNATPGIDSLAGTTDDTSSLLKAATGNNGPSWLHGINVMSTLDANINYNLSANRRATAVLAVLNGAAGLDAHASNPVANTGDSSAPVASAFTIAGSNRLIVAVANIQGAHVNNPPTVPAGYTILGTVQATGTNDPGVDSHNTMIVATRDTAGAAGAIAAATFGGLSEIGDRHWSTLHFAVAP